MSSNYFTIIHIIVLFAIALLSILFIVLSLRAERKLFLSLFFTNILVSTTLAVFLMLVLDKYTKKGIVEAVKSERVLRNESIIFRGQIRNVGKFTISKCTLTIKLINQPLNKNDLNGEALFKPSGISFFSWVLGDDEDERPNTVAYKFDVAQNLPKQKVVPFTVTMPYPPYFKNGMNITKLNCY
jgi:hypothetical protein